MYNLCSRIGVIEIPRGLWSRFPGAGMNFVFWTQNMTLLIQTIVLMMQWFCSSRNLSTTAGMCGFKMLWKFADIFARHLEILVAQVIGYTNTR